MVNIVMLLSVIFLFSAIVCIIFFPTCIQRFNSRNIETIINNTETFGVDTICETAPSTPKADEILSIETKQ